MRDAGGGRAGWRASWPAGVAAGLLASACAATAGPATRDPATSGGSALPPTDAEPAETAPDPAPSAAVDVDRDIVLVVGGSFSPDHIGPDRHAEVAERVRLGAAEYLARFDALFLQGDAPDLQQLEAHLPTLLELTAEGDPARTAAMAMRLRRAYPLALELAADRDARERLRQRLLTLDVLLARLDTGPTDFTGAAEPSRICAARDDGGRSVLRVERDCSCGERMACRVVLDGETLALHVALDDSTALCDDCYQTTAICLLPELPASSTLTVTLAGRVLGTLAVGAAAALDPGACLDVAAGS